MNQGTNSHRQARPVVTANRRAVETALVIVMPMIGGLAALGGLGSFTTVRQAAQPYFGHLAWIVPIGMDVGIVIQLVWDLLMEFLDLGWPVLRWVAWAYIAATVAVNVDAARGDLARGVMHAAMPGLFVTVIEGVRHLIRRWIGLASGRRREPIPAVRWLLAPWSSGLLWRRMVLWHVTVYRQGLRLEYEHLLAVSGLQQLHGQWTWRWRAPLAERLALRLQSAEASLTGAYDSVTDKPDLYDSKRWLEPYGRERVGSGRSGTICADNELLASTRRILVDADRQGVRLSNTTLAKRLREAGHSFANGRIGELADAARDDAAHQGYEVSARPGGCAGFPAATTNAEGEAEHAR